VDQEYYNSLAEKAMRMNDKQLYEAIAYAYRQHGWYLTRRKLIEEGLRGDDDAWKRENNEVERWTNEITLLQMAGERRKKCRSSQ
jgi:hypothetical protein